MLENQHFSLTGICEIWLVSIELVLNYSFINLTKQILDLL